MKKLLLFGLLMFLNCILDACTSDATCYDIEISDTRNFTLDGFSLLNAGDTSAVSDYAILLEATAPSNMCRAPLSFGGSLQAEQPVFILNDEVVNISIKSNADLSSNFTAASELKSSRGLGKLPG